MPSKLNRGLVGSLLLGAAVPQPGAAAGQPAAALSPHPVDAFIGDILTDSTQLDSRCDHYLGEIDRRLAELAAERGPATIERTLQRYDDLVALFNAAGGEFALYREVMLDDAGRSTAGKCEVRLSAAGTRLSLSQPIYQRLKAISPGATADPATRLYLARTLEAFDRAGVGRSAPDRAKIQALQDTLAQLGTTFDKNIADGTKSISVDPDQLAGLPADFIAAHQPAGDGPNAGKVTITTDYPDLIPVMTYASSEPLRRQLYEAFNTRAHPANDAVLSRILDTRQQLATLLGRKDYATLMLEDKMLDTPAKVETLIADMAAAAHPVGERDLARKLAVLKAIDPAATTLPPWSNAFITQLVQKQQYDYDAQALRQYFAYDNVRDGILKLARDLFGVEIRPWQTARWDPLVETYEVFEQGRLIGRFYLDSHPRPGKYNHANAIGLRAGIAGRIIPMGALVMNLPAGDHTTGLMEHGDVETFLHEFGHLLHGLLGGQTPRWAGQSGVATEWDFVEAPSQMLEEWVYDYDTLKTFAVNAKGEPIPRALVDKLNAARYFDLGMGDMRQLGYANASLRLHQGPAPGDLGARFRELEGRYDMLPLPAFTQMQDSFGHLNGYSAIYYTYRWSKVIADDMFTQFQQHGLRDRATALRYRQLVLAPGGSKPAKELVESFLGRPISLDAYKAQLLKDK